MLIERPPEPVSVPVQSSGQALADALERAELDLYVRRTATQGLLALAALLVGLGLVGLLFEPQLLAATAAVQRALGVPGLALLIFLADSLTTPIPPDLALVVVAKSRLALDWAWIVPCLGLVSAIAGNVGYALGLSLRETRLARLLSSRLGARDGALLRRYGWAAVALGALTPIPFSVTCWAAGMLRVRWGLVAAACLLRVPRFIVYYLLIAHSTELLRALW